MTALLLPPRLRLEAKMAVCNLDALRNEVEPAARAGVVVAVVDGGCRALSLMTPAAAADFCSGIEFDSRAEVVRKPVPGGRASTPTARRRAIR